ncbi:hypothetical protein EZH22_21590 [Xanthobacter dioxanivorans]|uniref:Bro-N domain-containing protein n=1 Tax=Xanthobacter dioxanivorans TaxID=2528964 RepID=A0A974PL66_9HYPH|nr:BRO family protein [Xanthobacter dioxanivorans]QRG05625.1 hypothetical protein EZH22_21590 [Xanthobacter dioxanivorans]
MDNLSLFNFKGHDVRVVVIDDAPWWVAADALRALGLSTSSGTSHQLQHLSLCEVRHVPRSTLGQIEVSFPNRGANCISESGLYKLVMRSDKPEARAFQDWVTRVVLPAIRKDGAYIMGEEKVATGEVTAEELAARVVDALGAKGIMGDVVKRLEAIGRRLTLEDQKPQFFAHGLKAAGYARPRGLTKKSLLAADKLERLPERQEI